MKTKHVERSFRKWVGSWFGLWERGSITMVCGDEECDAEHEIVIWQRPGEDTWEVIQRQVQEEFDRAESV